MHAECTTIDGVRLMQVLVAEAVFAFFYNRWVAKQQTRNGGIYTAFYVAGGVVVTVGLMALVVGWTAAMLVLTGFGASGLPMIFGSMQRHTQRIKSTTDETIAETLEALRNGSEVED